jgi:hypothetical protein
MGRVLVLHPRLQVVSNEALRGDFVNVARAEAGPERWVERRALVRGRAQRERQDAELGMNWERRGAEDATVVQVHLAIFQQVVKRG